MSEMNSYVEQQPSGPNTDLKSLDRLVGTWKMTGDTKGKVTYEWMEGGFFLIQHVDLDQGGQKTKGIEIIGHLRSYGEKPSKDIKSRYYDPMAILSIRSMKSAVTHS